MGEEVCFPIVLSIHFSFSFITGKQDAAYPSNSIQLGTKPVSGSYTFTHHLDRQKKIKKLEHIGKVIFDIPFMIRSHAESMKKNPGSPLGSTN